MLRPMARVWLGWLVLASSAVAAGSACSSFEASEEPVVETPDAGPEAEAPMVDAAGASDANDTDAATGCVVSEASDAAPDPYCLGAGQSPVDLTSSALHCGRCGHSCRGTTCTNGLCASERIHVAGTPYVGMVTASHAYYTSGPDVQRVSLQGGNVDVVARTGVTGWFVQTFAASGDELYVQTSNSNVFDLGRVASLASGDAGIVSLFAAAGSATGLAADTGNLYVVQYANVLSLPKTGAPSLGLVQQSPSSDSVVGPVSRDEILYWAVVQGPRDGSTPDQLLYARLKDGTIVKRADHIGSAAGLAVDATHIYWADTATASIMRVERQGTSPPTVVARWPGVNRYIKGLSVEGSRVYWAVTDSGQGGADATIYEAPTCATNGSVVVTAHPAGELFSGFIADATHVYYGGLSGVWRVAR